MVLVFQLNKSFKLHIVFLSIFQVIPDSRSDRSMEFPLQLIKRLENTQKVKSNILF